MKDGMKARAQRIINTSLELIALKTKENPRTVLEKAVDQIAPYVKVASQKRGARNVLLPKPLTPRQRKRIGIQWISDQASSRKGNSDFGTRIGQEIIAIINNESQLLAKKENVHKQAVANRSNLVLQDRRLTRAF
ncbi:hypothetical protein HDV06_006640 [Boothiomyces sp. JEL0866]|nr:hypothetical protein HDV06_006640 [Boothiomyces sp. JEL0866]